MAVTGSDLSKYFDNKVSQSYSGYLDNTKKNRLMKDAFLRIIEDRYNQLPFQKSLDEEGYLNTTNAVFNVNNNQIYTAPLVVTKISTTGLVTTYLPHNCNTGDLVVISNSQGLTPSPDGSWVITVTGPYTFDTTYVGAGTYLANSATITYSNMIKDYWHVLSIRPYFEKQIYNLSITNATNATPIVLTVNQYSQLRTGDNIVISGVGGNTNANGTRYIKVLNNYKIALYSDADLQVPIAGNANYTSGGIISKTYWNDAKSYLPRTKISVLNTPTPDKPRFENAERYIKIYPLNVTCSKIEIDYVRQPDIFINVADNVMDLTAYYPEKFLFHLTDVAAQMFAMPTRDPELNRMSSQQMQENP